MSNRERSKGLPDRFDIPFGQDMFVLLDYGGDDYPIAIHGCDWWLTKTEVADLITALTKALQEAP